jgi:hypothetical protein
MRKAIIATTAAALFSSPALTRQPSQGEPSIPDFSGIWGRLSFPGFEPPLAGPGLVTNRMRAPNGAGSLYGFVGDYANPILKAQPAEIVKKRGEIEQSGALAPSPRNQCWPGGRTFRPYECRNADDPAA